LDVYDLCKQITNTNDCLSDAIGDRPNGPFPNMMIVITDGDTINEADAIMQADLARQEGITLIVIGNYTCNANWTYLVSRHDDHEY
jgi:hypothetical protein